MNITTTHSTFARSLLALALAASAGLTQAATTFHAEINTAAFAGGGWLDFQFIPGSDGAVGATATLSHFTGAFGSEFELTGGSGSLATGVNLFNVGIGGNLFHSLSLGGTFGFDISFGGDFAGTAGNVGTTFSVGLLGPDQSTYLGNPDGALFKVDLMPMDGSLPASVTLTTLGGGISTVTAAVPEPASYALLLGGLAVLGGLSRRRQAR